jgi:hypothetical protein
MRSIKFMKAVSEKINENRRGGFMKIRLMAVVLGAIAIMTSGVAVAQQPATTPAPNTGSLGVNMNISCPLTFEGSGNKVNTKDLFATILGLKNGSDDDANTVSAWKCESEERVK